MTKFYNLSKVLKLNILRKVFEINIYAIGSGYLLKVTEYCIKLGGRPIYLIISYKGTPGIISRPILHNVQSYKLSSAAILEIKLAC